MRIPKLFVVLICAMGIVGCQTPRSITSSPDCNTQPWFEQNTHEIAKHAFRGVGVTPEAARRQALQQIAISTEGELTASVVYQQTVGTHDTMFARQSLQAQQALAMERVETIAQRECGGQFQIILHYDADSLANKLVAALSRWQGRAQLTASPALLNSELLKPALIGWQSSETAEIPLILMIQFEGQQAYLMLRTPDELHRWRLRPSERQALLDWSQLQCDIPLSMQFELPTGQTTHSRLAVKEDDSFSVQLSNATGSPQHYAVLMVGADLSVELIHVGSLKAAQHETLRLEAWLENPLKAEQWYLLLVGVAGDVESVTPERAEILLANVMSELPCRDYPTRWAHLHIGPR